MERDKENKEEVVLFDRAFVERAFRREQQEKARKLKQLEAMAADGVASAQVKLGLFYATGAHGYAKDMDRAMELLAAAAAQGSGEGRNYLAICYRKKAENLLDGAERSRCKRRAFELFTEGARAGDALSVYYLGLAYENGSGVTADGKKALECYKAAAEMGNLSALTALGVCHFSGIGMERDIAGGTALLAQAAERGDPRAQCVLGDLYMGYDGVAFEPDHARQLYEAAAAQNYPRAFAALAVIYSNGFGRAAEPKKAVELLERAAELGYAPAVDCLRQLGQDVSRFAEENGNDCKF